MRRWHRSIWIAPLALLTACADTVADEEVAGPFSFLFAGLSADGCAAPSSGAGQFPAEVDSVVVRVSDYKEGAPFGARLRPGDLDRGQAVIVGVPPGENLTLDVYACEGDKTAWSGRSTDFAVRANAKASPTIYLTKRDAMSCTGAGQVPGAGLAIELTTPRAFPGAVETASGRVLLAGGFDKYTYKSNGPQLEATAAAAGIIEYFPNRGLFFSWTAKLTTPRGFHHTVSLGDERVLILGGATQAVIGKNDPPIAAIGEPLGVEVIDGAARTVQESTLGLVVPLMGAVAAAPDGTAIVACGGRQSSGFPSNLIQHVAGTADAIAAGTATVVENETLSVPRMGHSATWLASSDIAIIGGNTDTDPNNFIELLSPDFDSTPVVVSGTPADYQPFGLHAAELARSEGTTHVILVAGGAGLEQTDASSVPAWIPPYSGPARLYAVTIDTAAKTATVQTLDAGITSGVRLRRVFAKLSRSGGDHFVLSGGYNQLGIPVEPIDGACRLDTAKSGCYLDDVTLLSLGGDAGALTLETAESAVNLSRPRFGHVATALRNGSTLFLGGIEAVSDSKETMSKQAEVWNPPLGDDPCPEQQ